jgi:hypothetical protein
MARSSYSLEGISLGRQPVSVNRIGVTWNFLGGLKTCTKLKHAGKLVHTYFMG